MDPIGDYNSNTDFDYEDKPLAGNLERLEDLLSQGNIFDVWYKDADERIGSEVQAEQNLNSIDAVNFLLDNANDFDRYMISWNRSEPDRLRVYENVREGFLGRFLPKRGDEIIFEYLEE